MKYKETIGIVGGMGSYATLDFFRRILDSFPAEKEWDRPRILIDNRCTMPSRVRAILYNENYTTVSNELVAAAKGLLNCGADYLIFACNTSHVFIPDVIRCVPEASGKIIHIIDVLARSMYLSNVKSAYLLASEGTIESKIYPDIFRKYDITIEYPSTDVYPILREFIEKVKQNQITQETCDQFSNFVQSLNQQQIILGCTEFPALMPSCGDGTNGIWDPLTATIRYLKSVIQ